MQIFVKEKHKEIFQKSSTEALGKQKKIEMLKGCAQTDTETDTQKPARAHTEAQKDRD